MGRTGPAGSERALVVGQELCARYGDDVARPRLGHQLRRQAAKQTGVGAAATTILAMQPGGVTVKRANASQDFEGDQQAPLVAITGDKYYDPLYWRPEMYFRHQDRTWRVGVTEVREGATTVGPLGPVRP